MADITVYLDKSKDKPLYRQIYDFYKKKIINGEIKANERLMSIMKLKNHLKVSRNTVETAYQQLLSEGYIYSKSGSGYFVNKLDLVSINANSIKKVNIKPYYTIHTDDKYFRYNFKPGSVDINNFPFKKWRKVSQEIMNINTENILTHSHPFGEIELRREIAKYLNLSRGVSCTYEQIVVGAGTQYLMTLLSTIFNDQHCKRIAFEEPGFSSSRKVFVDQEYSIYPIPVKKDGLSVNHLMKIPMIKDSSLLIYTTPSNQFPNGVIMPIAKRIKLLNWVSSNNCYVVEDDFDSEYRYDVNPIPSLHSIDKTNKVIYLGTFSKTLFSSMRVAYMVLPELLMNKLIDNGTYLYQTASKVHQLTIAKLMETGIYDAHIRKMRKIYADKQQHLVKCIGSLFGNKVRVHGESSGLNIVLQVSSKYNECELISRAMEKGVKVYPVSFYYYDLNHYNNNAVILGYGHLSLNEITDSMELLKQAWFG